MQALNFPDKKYDIIYADPPWEIKKSERKVRPNQGKKLDYPVMKLKDIKEMNVASISEDNAVLFLWTTHRWLPGALEVMDAWGYRYNKCLTWDKGSGMCLQGFHMRTELLLFGYRGRLETFPRRKALPTILFGDRGRHSEKPASIRDMISIFGDKRIELFARKPAEGWDAWGNEVTWSQQNDNI